MSQPIKKVTQNTTPTKAPSVASSTVSAGGKVNQDVDSLIKKLQTKTDAVNANNVARVANSQLVSADDHLHPLVSLKTNRPIERFPETPRGVGKLSITLVDSTLLALEADRSGKEEEKRERLRIQLGLKPNPA